MEILLLNALPLRTEKEGMNQLILKYLEQTITFEEKKELSRLVHTNEKIRKEFAYAQNIYALSALLPKESDINEGYDHLYKFKKHYKKTVYTLYIKKSLKYAAVIAITMLITLLSNNKQDEENPIVAYEEFTTPPGQRALLKLHDGTTVWLNASSTLRYPNVFKHDTRKVELNGEAYFDVVHNEKLPFIVSTENLDIKVLGTKFNVFAYKGDHEFNAYLEEGEIKIYDAKDEAKALFLKPEEVAVLKGNKLTKKALYNKDFLLWKSGIYSFDDLAFEDIIRKLELYYDISIDIENERLAKYRFNGKFRQRDGIVSALRTFQKAYNFSFYKDDERNHITIK